MNLQIFFSFLSYVDNAPHWLRKHCSYSTRSKSYYEVALSTLNVRDSFYPCPFFRVVFISCPSLAVPLVQNNCFKSFECEREKFKLYFIFLSLQVIVWGDYGRMDHKCFMGVAQILLEELDLSSMVIGWYKLFPPSSLVDPTLTPLTRRASQSSLESSTGPPCIRS